MRSFVVALLTVLLPVFASAQETKSIPLADYVSFCLALWADAPDTPSQASALELKDAFGSPGYIHGKSTVRFFNGIWDSKQTLNATTTRFTDGKGLSCVVTMPSTANRAELETLEHTLHLDGQIMNVGPTIVGRWKIPDRTPAVLLSVLLAGGNLILRMQQFEPTAGESMQHH